MKKWLKLSLWGLGLLIVIGMLVYSKFQPVVVQTVQATTWDVVVTVEEKGKVVNQNNIDISSDIQGKVISIGAEVGDTVNTKTVLLKVDTRDLKAQIAQLKGELKAIQGTQTATAGDPNQNQIKQQQNILEQANVALSLSREALKRAKQLFAEGAISNTEIEQCQADYDTKEQAFAEAQTSLTEARVELATLTRQKGGSNLQYQGQKESITAKIKYLEEQVLKANIKAPMAGIILAKNIKLGDYVNAGSLLFVLADNNNYHIETYIRSKDIANVKKDALVEVIFKAGDKDLKVLGKISKIAPVAEEQISALGISEDKIRIDIQLQTTPNGINIIPGMNADVIVTTQKATNVVNVIKDAVFNDAGNSFLWVVKDNKATLTEVEKGIEGDTLLEIKHGLQAGELVILTPHLAELKEGLKVKGNMVK